MFRFENPTYIYAVLLWAIVAVWLYYWLLRRRKQALSHIGEPRLVERLIPNFSLQRNRLQFAGWAMAIACIGMALANPQIGSKTEKVTGKGIDVIIALDVSKSMLTEDIAPNRLERSKQAIAKMIDRMKDDRLGMVVFAGSAYLQMPLSSDYSAAKMMLQTINTELMPTQGTAIGQAIEVALQSFKDSEENLQNEVHRKNKAIVVLSDGEDHEEGAMVLAQKAAEQQVAVYTVGVGSEKGGTIPVIANGRRIDNKRDDDGNEVVSKLNEAALREIARTAKGSYFRLAGSGAELEQLLKSLDTLEKREFEDRIFTDYADQFQYFIALALLLVLAELLLPQINGVKRPLG